MEIRKVSYADIGDITARVNRNTGELELNNNIFDRLPKGPGNYVLLYNYDHVVLKTADEFKTIDYAISKFLPVHSKTDDSGRNIVVMTETLSLKAGTPFRVKNPEQFSNFDPISAIADAVKGVVQTLPALGIGSKQRVHETKASYEAQGDLNLIQAGISKDLGSFNTKNTTNMMIIGSGLAAALIIIYFGMKSF